MKNRIVLVGLTSMFMLSGCATMFGGGGEQEVKIQSNKPVKIAISYSNGVLITNTTAPTTIQVSRKNTSLIIKSVNNEFDPIRLDSETNPWAYFNIVWGVWGLSSYTSTDRNNGSAWRYEENVVLPKIQQSQINQNQQDNYQEQQDNTKFIKIQED